MRRSLSEVLLILFVLCFEASQLCLSRNLTEGCIEEERQALLKLRDSFENSSTHFLAWKGKQCCRWTGVKCDGVTGHVVNIDLSPKRYSMELLLPLLSSDSPPSLLVELTNGAVIVEHLLSRKEMSPALLEFKHLSYLDLSLIDFQDSPIPMFLGSMKQLRYLNLSHCFFSGRVPHHLGNLSNLQILDLKTEAYIWRGDQDLYIDDFTWVSQLSSLQYIDTSGVRIRNEINSMMQVILNLPILLQAHFEFCGINSSKSSQGFVNSSSLPSLVQVLNLGGNFLNVIPKALQNMTSLRSLYLSGTFIDSVPLWLGNFNFLAHLDLAWNIISGQFPIAIQNMSSLTFLDISGNKIDSVPLRLGKFKFLAHLDLANNSISGQFRIAIQNMSSLTFIDISRNKIDSVPLWLGEFPFLTHLSLAWNQLTGSFPIAIQNISTLNFLDLANNNLTSSVPLWFIKRVQRVFLDNNKLSTLESFCPLNPKINCNLNSSGLLPDNKFHGETFGSSKNTSVFIKNDIQELDLSHNELKDSLESLGELKNLMNLRLASNFLSGPIPLSFRIMTKLEALILKDNQLNGTIPAFFGRLSALRYLELSGNHLIDVIPNSLGKLQNLTTLDLSGNYLSGIIPDNLGKLINLMFLDLSYNSFEGTLKEIHLDNLYYLQA